MSISASQVKELREMSGVGMMECKKALVETNGDLQQALDLLRANSSLKAEKKASRVAADGAVKIAETSSYVSLVEINSETDFAAKDAQFKDFISSVADHLASSQIDSIEVLNEAFDEQRQTLIQSIGENIQLRRLSTLTISDGGSIGSNIHSDGRLAALVSLNVDNQDLAKDIAMPYHKYKTPNTLAGIGTTKNEPNIDQGIKSIKANNIPDTPPEAPIAE